MIRRMLGRGRPWWPLARRWSEEELVVAGTPTRQEGEQCLQALRRQGIPAHLRQGRSGFEVWVPASQEARARLLLGLSGRSCIRVPRRRPTGPRAG
jgi:hypothetical protein